MTCASVRVCRLQRFVSGKETLESELYSRFTLVLNEKKAKIRSLQKNLTHLQETRYIVHTRPPSMTQPNVTPRGGSDREEPLKVTGYHS